MDEKSEKLLERLMVEVQKVQIRSKQDRFLKLNQIADKCNEYLKLGVKIFEYFLLYAFFQVWKFQPHYSTETMTDSSIIFVIRVASNSTLFYRIL